MSTDINRLLSMEQKLEEEIKERMELKALKDLTHEDISDMDDQELVYKHWRLHQIYFSTNNVKRPEWLLEQGLDITEEMIRRGIKHESVDTFDLEKKKYLKLSDVHGDLISAMKKIGDIVIKENFINLVGSAIRPEDDFNDIDVLIAQDGQDENLINKIKSSMTEELQEKLHPFYNGGGPQGEFIPLFDLVARPKFSFSVTSPEYNLSLFEPVNELNPFEVTTDLSMIGKTDLYLEPNINGKRIQVHKKDDEIKIFAANEELPYLALKEEIRDLGIPDSILIGELSADNVFWVNDILFYRTTELCNMMLETRKKFLNKLELGHGFLIRQKPHYEVTDSNALKQVVDRLSKDGHTQFVLKEITSTYSLEGQTEEWHHLKLEELLSDGSGGPSVKAYIENATGIIDDSFAEPKGCLYELTEELANPLTKYKDKSGRFVIQAHYRGIEKKGRIKPGEKKSLHVDFRFDVGDHLEGFELVGDEKKHNALIKSPKKFTGTKYETVWKKSQPESWINVEGWVEPGEIGATAESYGFFDIVDKGTYQFGVLKPDFVEIFIDGKKFKGRYVVRQLRLPVADGGTRESWQFWKSKDDYPYCSIEANENDPACSGFDGIKGYPGKDDVPMTIKQNASLQVKIISVKEELNDKKELVKKYRGIALAEGFWNNVWYRWEDIKHRAPEIVGVQIREEHTKKADGVHGYITDYMIHDDTKELEIEFGIFTEKGQKMIDKSEKEGLSVGVEVDTEYNVETNRDESRDLKWGECSIVENPACKKCWIDT